MDELQVVAENNGMDIICITETWLVSDNETIQMDGYHPAFRNDRLERQGGGVLCFVKNTKSKNGKI